MSDIEALLKRWQDARRGLSAVTPDVIVQEAVATIRQLQADLSASRETCMAVIRAREMDKASEFKRGLEAAAKWHDGMAWVSEEDERRKDHEYMAEHIRTQIIPIGAVDELIYSFHGDAKLYETNKNIVSGAYIKEICNMAPLYHLFYEVRGGDDQFVSDNTLVNLKDRDLWFYAIPTATN
jgi:hypothetical protein